VAQFLMAMVAHFLMAIYNICFVDYFSCAYLFPLKETFIFAKRKTNGTKI